MQYKANRISGNNSTLYAKTELMTVSALLTEDHAEHKNPPKAAVFPGRIGGYSMGYLAHK
jgi:hypothetical protein